MSQAERFCAGHVQVIHKNRTSSVADRQVVSSAMDLKTTIGDEDHEDQYTKQDPSSLGDVPVYKDDESSWLSCPMCPAVQGRRSLSFCQISITILTRGRARVPAS